MNVGEFSNYIEELNFKNILMHKGGKSYELLEKGLLWFEKLIINLLILIFFVY